MKQVLAEFEKLLCIMDELRVKCPWDSKQDYESLRHLTIEEVYELADAILDKDYNSIMGELGDIMLHIVFYAKLGEELGVYNMKSVLEHINKKLIERHPQVFGDVTVQNEEQVKQNWEKIKLNSGKKSVLEGVPISLPSVVKAYRIQEKAKGIGFEWENKEQVWDKVLEEFRELCDEINNNTPNEKIEEEFGDLMFALINYGRFLNINAENALEKTNRKFIRRFQAMEEIALSGGKSLQNMTLSEMDALWNEVKLSEH